ncbi:MAG: FmdB family zinc ribbon protein [Gammaproteobacteria bacterium]|mgnify:CR=1 FL=1|jgi:putative FmdB family regulatory protein
MPIYEYQCQSCGHKQEIMHRISQTPSLECAACGANELKKLISAVGFQLKGTGWYETDFKNKGEAKKSERTSGESNSDKTAPDKKDSNTEKKSAASESKSASKKSDAAKSDN